MKTRFILPFAVLGILLALLLAVSACDDDDDDDDDGLGDSNGPPTAEPAVGDYGGPYPFALHEEEAAEKERDFECYKELGLSLAEAVTLKEASFLKDSIEKNEKFPDRTDSQKYDTQKYNFVIAEIEGNEEIIVAVWKNNAHLNHNKKVSEKCQGRQCQEPGRRDFGLGDAGIMVNLFPEKDEELFKKSPCWLDSDRKDGLLDAISKHFLLAQLAQGEGRTIADFNRNVWYEWTAEKVLYAGEIIVDLKNCTLDVNGNSGTYRPKISHRPLNEVGVRFDDLLSSEEILSGVC